MNSLNQIRKDMNEPFNKIRRKLNKELKEKVMEKKEEPFFYECPDCGFSTKDKNKTEHDCK